jgi:protein-S-isoprenylcysteine O-methyltransferase Ste14
LIAIGNFLFRFRNYLFPLVFLPLAILTAPRPLAGDWSVDLWLDVAGFALIVAGQGLRVLVIGLAYIRRGGREGKIYAETLVQEGLFAHSRNPMYCGNLLVIAGFLLVLNNVWGYALAAPFFLIGYLAITAAEESYLTRQFGEPYRQYMARVPRFVPRLAGLGATLRGMRFDWPKVIRKEYGTLFLTGSLSLWLVSREITDGVRWSDRRAELAAIGAAWVALGVSYVVARALKKTGALGTG